VVIASSTSRHVRTAVFARIEQSLATISAWPACDEGHRVSLPHRMMSARAKSAIVVLVTLWAVQVAVVLPVMWVGGASSSALVGAAVFAGVVAAALVGIPVAVAEHRQRRRSR
jgi:hypothetical protein